MKVGIIVAMSKELKLLLPLIENRSELRVNGFDLHIGRIGNVEVAAMQSGIGKVNAAVGTLTLIDSFHPSLVVNSGVAGGTGGGAGVLDVVIATRVAYHDVWCGPGNQWGTVEGCPPYFEATAIEIDGDNIKHGLVASGDMFISRTEDVERIRSLYPDAIACDMESGAIAQVCHLKNVPFSVIRVVSDTPDSGDNFSQYVSFWDDAPAKTFDILKQILEKF